MGKFGILNVMRTLSGNKDIFPSNCPKDIGLIDHCAGNGCRECWEIASDEMDDSMSINRIALILLRYCKAHEICDDCCLNGKCVLMNPDNLDEENYKWKDEI